MRVGRNWPQLFSEAAFQEALTCACKAATPLCLVWTTRTARRAGLTAAACCEVCADPSGAHEIWCETLARVAVDALGKLEQRHREAWETDARRHDAAVLDDVATTRSARVTGGQR